MTSEEKDKLQQTVNKYTWYHTIKVADGVYTKGFIEERYPVMGDLWRFMLGEMQGMDFTDKRVLDIACRDCLFSFEAERKGAKEVVGIDNRRSHGAADFLIPYLQSKVKIHEMNLLDLEPETFGAFDVILFYGLLYHLRYPVWSLRKAVNCLSDSGFLVIESGMLADERFDDYDVLYCPVSSDHSPYGDITSCTYFNKTGLCTTLRSLGCTLVRSNTFQPKPAETAKTVGQRVRQLSGRVVSAIRRTVRGTSRGVAGSVSAERKFPPLKVNRQFFVFQKDVRLKQEVADNMRYWEGIHTVPLSESPQ